MKARRKTGKTSIVRNPARRLTLSAQPNGRRSAGVKKRRRRNPSTVTTVKTVRRKVRRNPVKMDGLVGLFVGGLAGGLTLGLAESGINTVAPNASAPAQILIKGGAAWAIHQFAGKLPVVGQYKNYIAGILAMFAGYDVWRYYVAPMLSGSGLHLPFGFQLYTEPTQSAQPTQAIQATQPKQIAAPVIDQNGLAAFVNQDGQIELYPA